jgi:ribosome-associated protein
MRDALEQQIRSVAREVFSRSGGPGGQNVNKVNTQVTVHVPLGQLDLSETERRMLSHRLANRITTEGELVVHCSQTRSQARNREIALERVLALIADAMRPQRVRRPTRPTRGATERRLQTKRSRGERKQLRKPPED